MNKICLHVCRAGFSDGHIMKAGSKRQMLGFLCREKLRSSEQGSVTHTSIPWRVNPPVMRTMFYLLSLLFSFL